MNAGFLYLPEVDEMIESMSQNGRNISVKDGDVDELLLYAAKEGKMFKNNIN